MLASSNYNGVIKLYGVVNTIQTKVLNGHTGAIHSIVFSPDSKLIASSSNDQTIKLWDVTSGKIIYTLKALSDERKWEIYSRHNQPTYNEYLKSYNSIQLDISPDGKLLASTNSLETAIKIWDMKSGELIKVLETKNPMCSIAFSPDNQLLAAGEKKEIILWDVASGNPHSQQLKLNSANDTVSNLKFSLNNIWLIAETQRNYLDSICIKIWNIVTGKEIKPITPEQERKRNKYSAYNQEKVILNNKGNTIIIESNYGRTHWRKLTPKQQITKLKPNLRDRNIQNMAFNREGDLLALKSEGAIYLWLIDD